MGRTKLNETFHSLLDNFRYGMFTTYNPRGELHVRPMVVAQLEENCDVWLLTGEQSGKAEEIHQTPHVSLSFQSDPFLYVVLYGTAELAHDQEKVQRLWTDEYNMWFPKGPTDPAVALIKVTTEWGEFWNHSVDVPGEHRYRFYEGELRRISPSPSAESHGRVQLR